MPPKDRPLLLVDVDGVVSLFGFDFADPPSGFPVTVDGIPHWLSEGAGTRLERLSRTFECVWCTGWDERAEEHLPRLLRLPGEPCPGRGATPWRLYLGMRGKVARESAERSIPRPSTRR